MSPAKAEHEIGGGLFFESINDSFAHQETRQAMIFGVGGEHDVSGHSQIALNSQGDSTRCRTLESTTTLRSRKIPIYALKE
jgi:hypothetical protein